MRNRNAKCLGILLVLSIMTAPLVSAHAEESKCLLSVKRSNLTTPWSGFKGTGDVGSIINEHHEDDGYTNYALRGLKLSEYQTTTTLFQILIGGLDEEFRLSRERRYGKSGHRTPDERGFVVTQYAAKMPLFETHEMYFTDARHYVGGLQICTSENEGSQNHVRGIKLWANDVRPGGKVKRTETSISIEMDNCTRWHEKVQCGAGNVAYGISGRVKSDRVRALRLVCGEVLVKGAAAIDTNKLTRPGSKR